MMVSSIVIEDFVNYRKPGLFIGASSCDFKCCKEGGLPVSVCQNHNLAHSCRDIPTKELIKLFRMNPITEAIIFGGLEPFLQIYDIIDVVKELRSIDDSDVVIYTGYYPDEVAKELDMLSSFPNIIVKFGRYLPGQTPHMDNVLGVELASDNQFAMKIS